MKLKQLAVLLTTSLLAGLNLTAQNNETFETETANSTSFTTAGQIFNITTQLSGAQPFDIQTAYPNTGWSGAANDNVYVDNSSGTVNGQGVGFTISSAGSVPFRVNSMWLYLSDHNLVRSVSGSLTIVGKLAGATQFTATAGSGFNTGAAANGFSSIDFTTFGGSNNTGFSIDQLVITTTAFFEYVALDAFNWSTVSCTAPTIISNPPNRAICAGGNTTFSTSATGATTYQWQVDQTGSGSYTNLANVAPYSGVTTSTLTVTGATGAMSGYRYRAVAINGVVSCFTNSNYGTLNVSAISTTGSQTNVNCNGGNNGNAAVSATGGIGGFTYSWSPSGGTSTIATGLSATNYTVTVTDGIGCSATQNFTITQPPVLNGSTVVTNVACFGGTTGAINLTPSGGAGGYTFSWGGGITTEDRTGLATGTYSVTITDANSCTRTVSGITVTQPTAVISGTTVVTNTTCNGVSNGAINLTPTGGTGSGYTFNWGGGITAEDRISLAAATYAVIITDANGCTGNVTGITVTQPTAVSGTTVVTNTSCNSGTNGSIDLTPSGGTPGYTYSWGGGVTTQDRTALAAGTYSVTITDANACTGTVSGITVTQPTVVSGTTVVTNVACFGGTTGAINLTPTGGTGGKTFSWGGGITTEDRTSLTAGTYTVIITDANGCTGTVNVTVTQPTAPVSGTTVVTNVSCFGGTNGAINLTPTGGTGSGYTFSWGGGITTEDRTGLAAGTYTVIITDANGCTGTVNATVTQPTSPVSGTVVVTNVSCFGGTNGAINLTPNGGTGSGYTFSWGGGATTEDRTGLASGTYTVIITDANGCTGTATGTITQPTFPVSGTTLVNNIPCFGGTGTINLTPTGGTGPGYTYSWGGGITTEDRTGLTAGTYTVIITDINGCTGTVNATVTQPTAISFTAAAQTNVSCFGGSNGAFAVNAAVGGAGGFTYDWAPGTPTGDGTTSVTGLTAQAYSVTATDQNGCTATINFTITAPGAISLTASAQTNVSCFGGSNGAASVNAATGGAGGFTYNWTPGTPTGDGTTSVTGLTAGTWTVTVTDANSCTATQSFTVTQPTAISFTAAAQTNVSCFGGSNGSFAVNAAVGGSGGFTYDWAPGTPTGDGTTSVTGLIAQPYSVTATDANGCTATISFTITEPTAISFTAAAQTNVSCFGGSNGFFAVNDATGGTGMFTYDWAPGTPTGDGTTSVTGLTAQAYSVTATDQNGCTATINFTITEPTPISLTPSAQTNVSCNGGSTGAASVNAATGGMGGFTYDWTPGTPTGDGTTSITALTAGTYTVTATDANGCTATQSFTVTQPALITSSVTVTECDSYTLNSTTYNTSGTYTQNLTAVNGCDSILTLNLTINNSTSSTTTVTECDSYEWTDGTTYTVSGTYTQDLTNSAGCDSTATLVLTINNSTSSTTTVTECDSYEWTDGTTYTVSGTYTQDLTNSVGCDSTATLVLTINNSTSSTTTVTECDSYEWTDGTTYTVSGTYTQDLTNSVGCDSTATLVLTINTTPTAGISQTSDVELQASGTGTYQWINCADNLPVQGETNAAFTATQNGSYAVVVSNGSCSDTSNCMIVDNVGLNELNTVSFTLAPNPTQDLFRVVMTGTVEATVVIFDNQGKVVQTLEHVTSETVISLANADRGMYLVQISAKNGTHTERIIKQ